MSRMCDCFPELKKTTLEREARFLATPEAPVPEGPQSQFHVKVRSIGNLNEYVECGRSGHTFIISEPVAVGGENIAPFPLEFLLAGATGCYAAVFAFYAAKLDVPYDTFEITAHTQLDVRGHMIPDAPPSNFQKVFLDIRISSSAPLERLREVERLALAGCPGINTLRHPVPVTSQITLV